MTHDIGKIYTRKENPKNKHVSFFGHENFSVQPTLDFMAHINSPYSRELVVKIVGFHMRGHKVQSFDELVEMANGCIVTAEYMRLFNYMDGTGRISENVIEQKV